ncbi:hypothetical protein ACWOEJ_06545 [Enterococcus eurekensis]|uniref:Uncharacterized protein n=1 Tax=Enterococcus eurekensis TaxID=1159753 RepID=A0ABV9M653_9ENTE
MQNFLRYLTLGGGGTTEKSITIKKYTKKDGSSAYMFNVYVGHNPQTKNNVYRLS